MEIVKLRLYREKETYDKSGKLISENQTYKVSYKTFDWDRFKKNIGHSFVNAEVLGVKKETRAIEEEVNKEGKKVPVTKFSYKDVEITDELKAEVASIFKAPEKELTEDQKTIAELKAQMAELTKGKKKEAVKEVEKTPNVDEELESARKAYYEKFEKKPHHAMKLASINEKLAAE